MTGNHFENLDYDIAVVGGGLVGLTAAVQLAEVCKSRNWRLLLVAAASGLTDNRTTALLMPSIHLIDQLGIWTECKENSAPLKTMRLIDGSKRLIRAPVTEFSSQEINEQAFGYNIPNQSLLNALGKKLNQFDNVRRIDCQVAGSTVHDNGVELCFDNGEHCLAKLVVAADGRGSQLRKSAGIHFRKWQYEQTAITMSFGHEIPHHFVSNEFHTETGPMTQVPLPSINQSENRSSLVWVVAPDQAADLVKTPITELARLVEDKFQSMFGRIQIESDVQAFPLSGMTVERFAANKIALVGEAAHVFPPIGAQGFNLGLRDVTDLAEAMTDGDLDDDKTIFDRYCRARTADAQLRTMAVDLLNRSLLTSFLPVQLARMAALSLAGGNSTVRRFLMKQGMGSKERLD